MTHRALSAFVRPLLAPRPNAVGVARLAALACTSSLALAQMQLPASQARQPLGREWAGPWDWSEQVNAPKLICPLDEFSHAVVLPEGLHKGKVMMWRRESTEFCDESLVTTRFWLFDPVAPEQLIQFTQILPVNIFCAGTSWNSNGELVVAGGARAQYGSSSAPRDTEIFRPTALGPVQFTDCTGQPPGCIPYPFVTYSDDFKPWIQCTDMVIPRFYPTLVPLSKRTLILDQTPGGTCTTIVGGATLALGGPRDTHHPEGNEFWELLPYDNAGLSWVCPFVPPVVSAPHTPLEPAVEKQLYSLHSVPQVPPLAPPGILLDSYPRAFQLSNSQILVAFDIDTNAYIPPFENLPGESWMIDLYGPPADRFQLWRGPHAGDGTLTNDRLFGTAVLLHTLEKKDRVLVFGGAQNGQVNDSVQEFQFGLAPNEIAGGRWVQRAPMREPRMWVNSVILPTGDILLVGGSRLSDPHQANAPVLRPELYRPGSSTTPNFTTLLSQSNDAEPHANHDVPPPDPLLPWKPTPRVNHSFAVLLPDGRVFVGGGEHLIDDSFPNAQYSGELFSPPYLFQGTSAIPAPFRPTLNTVTGPFELNSQPGDPNTFLVDVTLQPGHVVDRAVLLRPAALTHDFDNDQRYIELEIRTDADLGAGNHALELVSPHESLAPPGFYTLWIIETEVPSKHRVPSQARFIKFV